MLSRFDALALLSLLSGIAFVMALKYIIAALLIYDALVTAL